MRRTGVGVAQPAYRERTLSTPRPDVFGPPSPQRQLPTRSQSVAGAHRPAWLFVAAHGGSGATLLSRLSHRPWGPCGPAEKVTSGLGAQPVDYPTFGLNAGRAWPDPALEPTEMAIVVCRTSMAGLAWARDAAAQYLAGGAPHGLRLIGVVAVADQPGRLPPPLAAARGLLAGAFPHTWHVPYVPAYRLLTGLPDENPPPVHPGVADVLAAIRCTVTQEGQHS